MKNGKKIQVGVEVVLVVIVETDAGDQEVEIEGPDHGQERRRQDIHPDLGQGKDAGRSIGVPGQDLVDLEVGQEVDLEGHGQDLTNAKDLRDQEVDQGLEVKVLKKKLEMVHTLQYRQSQHHLRLLKEWKKSQVVNRNIRHFIDIFNLIMCYVDITCVC